MPAVNPTRLRFQIEELLKSFTLPETFHRRLVNFFSLYANQALHFGETQQKIHLAPRYHLPLPLVRELHLNLKPLIIKNPQGALELADEIWPDPYLEIKQLAIFILGNVPADQPQPILDRIKSWLDPDLDDTLISDLLKSGSNLLRNEFPDAWENFIKDIIDQNNPQEIGFGIHGIIATLEESDVINYPTIFRLISPLILAPHSDYLQELEKLIKTLIKSSSTETAFFLKQTLSLSQSPETARLIKRCLPLLPQNLRQELFS